MMGSVRMIRCVPESGIELGVAFDRTGWFVFDRATGYAEWHKHCGPYPSSAAAEGVILDLCYGERRGAPNPKGPRPS
jgi:hypothetical protein